MSKVRLIRKFSKAEIDVLRWLSESARGELKFFAPLGSEDAIALLRTNGFIEGCGWESDRYRITEAGRASLQSEAIT